MQLSKDEVIALDNYSGGCECPIAPQYTCSYCRDVKRRLHSKDVATLNTKGLMTGYQLSPRGWQELNKRRAK